MVSGAMVGVTLARRPAPDGSGRSLSPGDKVLLRYGKSNGWLDQPAVITRAYGKGRITYIGAELDDELIATAAQWFSEAHCLQAVVRLLPHCGDEDTI